MATILLLLPRTMVFFHSFNLRGKAVDKKERNKKEIRKEEKRTFQV